MGNSFVMDFLSNPNNLYLSKDSRMKYWEVGKLLPKDLALYYIEEISFEDKSPRKEALENVLSSMRIEGINFIYVILGDDKGVHFYYGVAKDLSEDTKLTLSISDIGKYVLEPSIKGNFRGSKVNLVNPVEKEYIVSKIDNMKFYSILEGVPGINKDDEKFQGVDRLVDTMLGDNFGVMIIAKPLEYDEVKEIEKNLYTLYSRISPLSKKSEQNGSSEGEGTSNSETNGSSETKGTSTSSSTQTSTQVSHGTSSGESKSTTKGTNSGSSSNSSSNSGTEGSNTGISDSKAKTEGETETNGSSTSNTTQKSKSTSSNKNKSRSHSTTMEYVDKEIQDWVKYLDETIIPRLDYGNGKGIFITSSFLFSDNKASLMKLENTIKSLYSGEKGNKVPLRTSSITGKNTTQMKMLKNFQIPFGAFVENISENELISRSALSQCVDKDKKFYVGNWITTNELSMISGLPQKEVVGLTLNEEVEFGLNFKNGIKEEDKITLGKLVQSGNIIDNISVYLDQKSLDKHIFVTGVTGSGKTTTCQKILIDSNLPFLIIEPAKTEYRALAKKYDDLMVFTLGKDSSCPFRLNPFEFFEHESITSRVDMLKASIESSFEMEAAIPQIIESSIYECYKDYGWNISNNKNKKYKNPFADGVYAFPTLKDLVNKIEVVVKEQGFDERLKNDYIGSIKARLQGLLVGSKGLMLNTRRSIDFKSLLNKRVVLEFEELRSGSEKSLVMGFVLTNLMEAIKANYLENGRFNHITLVEEAHRLLSKYTPGDSLNKKQGVETFTDMLAEIRKYGESLIIVDQIPNKLTPEILKNTNTKIVHKIFAQDDKEAIGNTIVLNKEQKEFLSNLETGRAIVFTEGFDKALQVQIDNIINTNSEEVVDEKELKKRIFKYYAQNYKKGLIKNSELFESEPETESIEMLLDLSDVIEFFKNFCEQKQVWIKENSELISYYGNKIGFKMLAKIVANDYYDVKKRTKERINYIESFLEEYSKRTLSSGELHKYSIEF